MKLLALLLISMQLAAEPVEDIHQQIEQYIGHREFAESFQTGDVYQITLAEDLRGIKSENHFKLDVTVNGSAARIGSSTVTAQEWAAWHGNFGRSITNFALEMGIK